MTGGHYREGDSSYIYYRVIGFADQVRNEVGDHPVEQRATRMAFARLLFRVAEAMREIDWVDSQDSSWSEEAMPNLRGLVTPAGQLESATRHAEEALELLIHELDRAKEAKP